MTLVVGDLGFGVVTDFAQRFPAQFLNVGVAEQNMTGVAAGMALAGKIVFTYSIANFPTHPLPGANPQRRLLSQRQRGRARPWAAAYAYGALGMTHHATEDLAIMRVLPEMTVIAPGDPVETAAATQAAAAGIGPVYLRLGRERNRSSTRNRSPGARQGPDRARRQRPDVDRDRGMSATAVAVADLLADGGITPAC